MVKNILKCLEIDVPSDYIDYINVKDIEIDNSNADIQEKDTDSIFLEARLANKVKHLKIFNEKNCNELSLIRNEITILNEVISRKETTILLLDEQLKTLRSTDNLLENENIRLRRDFNDKNKEISK